MTATTRHDRARGWPYRSGVDLQGQRTRTRLSRAPIELIGPAIADQRPGGRTEEVCVTPMAGAKGRKVVVLKQ